MSTTFKETVRVHFSHHSQATLHTLLKFGPPVRSSATIAMTRTGYLIACLLLVIASLQCTQARSDRSLLQSSSSSSEAQAAASATSSLSSSPPNPQAAAASIAQAAAAATVSSSSSSTALASTFVNALVNANVASGNATAQAFASALSNTSASASNQQIIAHAYASALLSFYEANNVQVCGTLSHCDQRA